MAKIFGMRRSAVVDCGRFADEKVILDKDALKKQLETTRHAEVRLCPHYNPDIVLSKIESLPDTIEADDENWILLYHSDTGKSAWIWPIHEPIPPTLRKTKDNPWRSGGLSISVDLGLGEKRGTDDNENSENSSSRVIPPTRYADIVGQDDVVEAVRDRIELPLKYADLYSADRCQTPGRGCHPRRSSRYGKNPAGQSCGR